MIEADQIEKIIPHRYPFLLVDRIIEIEEGKRAVGIKNVTANEWFFEGHFPGRKVMPGVLIVEALAQVAAVSLLKGVAMAGKTPLFGGIEGMRFRKPVVPGDQLRLEFTLEKMRGPIGKGRVKATVDGKLAAEGVISFALVDLSAEAPE
ncbi:MAG: 3-hydroxyacyl-ACP dehydratase FabZ [Anaerolineaceae bacterium]